MARIGWVLEAEAAAVFPSLEPDEFARAVRSGEVPASRKLAGRPLRSRRDLEARSGQGG